MYGGIHSIDAKLKLNPVKAEIIHITTHCKSTFFLLNVKISQKD